MVNYKYNLRRYKTSPPPPALDTLKVISIFKIHIIALVEVTAWMQIIFRMVLWPI